MVIEQNMRENRHDPDLYSFFVVCDLVQIFWRCANGYMYSSLPKIYRIFFVCSLVSAYEEIERTSLIQIYGCYSRCVDNNDTSAYKSPESIRTFIFCSVSVRWRHSSSTFHVCFHSKSRRCQIFYCRVFTW